MPSSVKDEVVKEREIEIGFPTDVKHVAHIGLDGADGSPPSWMNEFKTGPDFSLSSLGSMNGSKSHSIGGSCRDPTWTSQDFEGSVGRQQMSDIFNNFPPTNLSSASKKQRRKKGKSPSTSKKSDSSPKSVSSRSRKSNLGKESDNANT
ncbi:hypothetical protein V2J09_002801 [Rumex salicifolius]